MLKELRKLAYLSVAVTAMSFSPPAHAAGPYLGDTVAGNCTGAVGGDPDCGTATGHIGVSVVGTLSINEIKAISFGNVAVTDQTPAGGSSVALTPAGALTGLVAGADGLILLSGADANGGTGGGQPGVAGNDGQQAGVYEIKGAAEGGQERVYITFTTLGGLPLDANGTTDYAANQVDVIGPAATNLFKADTFVFTAPAGATVGRDVYGNYIDGGAAALAAAFRINVGATLKTSAASTTGYPEGKYVGEFNITASY